MLSRHTLLTLIAISGLMIVGAVFGIYTSKYYHGGQPAEPVAGLLWPDPKQLNSFTTVDHTGVPFTVDRLRGKWSLLFFGYTHCPDVCPLTLSVLSSIQDRLPSDTRTIFVTVDPGRDTPPRLTEYIRYFDDRMIALGGSIEQISGLTSQIGIVWSHGPVAADGNYPVNHSTAVFLVDPEARLVGIFSAPHQPDTLVNGITSIQNFIKQH